MRYIILTALMSAVAVNAAAQQVRGSLNSVGRYIEVRPMRRDTVDQARVVIDENGRPSFEGQPVFCLAQTCTIYRPADAQHAVAMAHDLSATSWSLGLQGLSASVYARARQNLAGDFAWPRSNDGFDVVLAYAELARPRYLVRLGRQRSLTGLGFYSFDGVSAWYHARDWLSAEVYGGRSLARALEDPRREALGAVESFIPDNEAWLIGAALDVHAKGIAGEVRYQREIWSDRAALVSERASFDVSARLGTFATVEAAADYDVAFNRLGKAHLSLRRQLRADRVAIDVTARRYLPFFELWTIWGAFSPVAYHELELGTGWRVTERVDLEARAGHRRYEDAEAAVFIAPAADASTRIAVRARLRAAAALLVDAEYQLETGFGAYLSSGEAALAWQQSERMSATFYATMFQQILEFRTGEAAVVGAGAQIAWQLTDELDLNGNLVLYRQLFDNRSSAVDWTQKRALLGVTWSFGRDPGVVQ